MHQNGHHPALNTNPQHGFARARERHPVLTLKRRGKERSLTFNPLNLLVAITVGGVLVLSVLASGTYLFLRDDLVSATLAQHARMQHAYEDRITALRAQVDLVTSRQLLDQQAVEDRVEALMQRQNEIGALQKEVSKAVKRAGKNKVVNQEKHTRMTTPLVGQQLAVASTGLRLGSLVGSSTPFGGQSLPNSATIAQGGPEFFDSLEASLAETEKAQLAELKQLKKSADNKAIKLAKILKRQGVRVPDASAIGGPLIELKSGNKFINTVNALDASLETLEQVRKAAKSLPHGSPAPGQRISSKFGSRRDPFTKRRAMHGGLDFKAERGSPVIATASGRVTKAGKLGGYGNLIEVDHGGGITTRYAHLSKILVKVGQRVAKGARIGKVGSTGRSTGPHLHYEVRRKGQVLDPIHYVRLAKYLKPYL